MVSVPMRCAPLVLAATVTLNEAPVPDAAAKVSHTTLGVAVHPQAPPFRVSVTVPAVPATADDLGDTVTTQSTFVGSLALALAEPPPDTLTWLVTCAGGSRPRSRSPRSADNSPCPPAHYCTCRPAAARSSTPRRRSSIPASYPAAPLRSP